MTASFPWICPAVVTWTGDSLNFLLFLESFIYISTTMNGPELEMSALSQIAKAAVHWTIFCPLSLQTAFKLGQCWKLILLSEQQHLCI